VSLLNPTAWNGIGIVSFLIVSAAFTAVALLRGWLVLGFNHREIVAEKDRRIEAIEKRSVLDGESIAKFADAAARSTAAAEVQQVVVDAIRKIAQERTS
jgi:hypothetical protein